MGSEFEIVEHSKSSGFQVEIISSITSIALPPCLPLFCSLLRLFVIVIYGQKDNRRLLMESKIQFKISNELLSENGVGEKRRVYFIMEEGVEEVVENVWLRYGTLQIYC